MKEMIPDRQRLPAAHTKKVFWHAAPLGTDQMPSRWTCSPPPLFLIPGCATDACPFSVQTIKYCNLSLSRSNANKQFIIFWESVKGLWEPVLGLRVPSPRLERAYLKPERALRKKVGEKTTSCNFRVGGPLDQGAHFTSLSEIWLHRCV